ncbi:Ribosomal protein L34 [Sesbania bispinosa]|nr:Ribosomal protein L34 [Sesbania bispinosa]
MFRQGCSLSDQEKQITKIMARTHGFRKRMRTPGGRAILKRRCAKEGKSFALSLTQIVAKEAKRA